MISVCFPGKPFNIMVIQVYAPTSNAEEAEVERFYEGLQDLLELTPPKDVLFIIGSSVQFSSVTQSCPTLCYPMNRSTPGVTVHLQLPESTQTHVHWVGDVIQPAHPLSSSSPPAPNPSQHQSLFQWVNLCMRWPKYWSFSFSIIPSKEIPGLIFRMDWLDLLAVQGTLKSFLQHHSSKASILLCSDFFILQLSYPYMTTGKTIAWYYGPLLAK